MYDLLFTENLTKQDIQAIKKVAVELLTKVKAKIAELDHWTDKQETKAAIDNLIRDVLWAGLPECYLIREVLPHMLKVNKGSIVNVASIASNVGFRGGLGYTMSKHAIAGLVQNVAFTYADTGVRINAVCPGGINTPLLTNGHMAGNSSELGMRRYSTGKPIKPRNCEPEEVAEVCLFLASDASSGMTGSLVACDAGASSY